MIIFINTLIVINLINKKINENDTKIKDLLNYNKQNLNFYDNKGLINFNNN